MTNNQRIHLLNDCERDTIYSLPSFTEAERHHYFYLNPIEEAELKGLHFPSRMHFILQLEVLRANRRNF